MGLTWVHAGYVRVDPRALDHDAAAAGSFAQAERLEISSDAPVTGRGTVTTLRHAAVPIFGTVRSDTNTGAHVELVDFSETGAKTER